MTDTYTALAATLFIAEKPYCVSQYIYLTLYFTPHAASSMYLGKQCKNRESKQRLPQCIWTHSVRGFLSHRKQFCI